VGALVRTLPAAALDLQRRDDLVLVLPAPAQVR
jgi:hypothetical protein